MTRQRVADLALLSGLALGLAVLVVFGFFDVRDRLVGRNDFTYTWAGARTIVDGGNPYEPAAWLGTVERYGTTPPREMVFGYPPWIALAAVPFALLPVPIASGLWTFGGMAAAALALRVLLRSLAPDPPLVHFLAGLALFASQPGSANVWSGQWTFILLAVLAVTVAAVRQRGRVALLATFLLTTKPQLVAFALPAFARAALARWGPRYLALAAAAPATAIAIGWLTFPGWIEAWRTKLFEQRLAVQPPTTLANGLGDLVGPVGAVLAAVVVLALVGAGLAFTPKGDAFLAVWLAISATTPIYSWSYDHLLLIVPLVITTAVVGRRSRRAGATFAAVAFGAFLMLPVLLYVVADARQNESFSIFVPLAVAASCIAVLWRHRSEIAPAD
ncbi:MAG: glycosyltransferase 87 family protein [Chloroflexota bacterium]|nr:glycosyltransferase 87 family protein [Chloroflexota bacterium]